MKIDLPFLKELVSSFGPKILVVTGKRSYYTSGAKNFIEETIGLNQYFHCNEFSPNPKVEDLEKIVEQLRDREIEAIVAIGGGSVLDMAKLINAFINQNSLNEYLEKGFLDTSNLKTLIAIPTTAGSGSESTSFAVLYKEGIKYSVTHPDLKPSYYLLHSEFLYKANSSLIASSGFDAFAQALESFWSINSNETSSKYSLAALKTIQSNLVRIIQGRGTNEDFVQLMNASNNAGKAINIAKTTAPHAFSYSLTTKFNIPHGQAVAIFLPFFFRYNYFVSEADVNDKRGSEFVKQRLNQLSVVLGYKDIDSSVKGIKKFIARIGLQNTLSQLNINQYTLSDLENVNVERLINNPRKISAPDMKGILDEIK